jgi:putative aldouronate transport system substrate-binding protein
MDSFKNLAGYRTSPKYFSGGIVMKRKLSLIALCVLAAAVSLASCGGAREKQQASAGPVTLSIFIDHPWYPVESFSGYIPEEITRLSGVVLEPTIAIDGQQLGVMIGSGELPDLVYTSSFISQMSDPDVSYSFEELIEKYKTGWKIPPKQLGIARGKSEDGKAYTILNHYSEKADWVNSQSVPMLPSLMYRTDLYQAIGSPPMRNFDELFAVFGKIKQAYPNLGAVLKINRDWNVSIFAAMTGLGVTDPRGRNFIEQSDGQYVWYTRDPRFRQALAFLNKCWQAGFVSPDESFFVVGSTVPPIGEWFASSACTQNQLPGSIAEHQAINPSWTLAEMVPFETSSFVSSNVGWSGTFITKSSKNPEAAIKFIQWMRTPEAQALTQMGRPGIDYTLNASGLPDFSAEWNAALRDGTHNKLYNPWFYLGGSETVEADSRVAPTDPALVKDAYQFMRDHYDNLPWVAAANPIGTSDEKVILDKIIELGNTYIPRLVMASTDAQFNSLYDEYLTNAGRTGLPKLEAYENEKIKEVMPLYR